MSKEVKGYKLKPEFECFEQTIATLCGYNSGKLDKSSETIDFLALSHNKRTMEKAGLLSIWFDEVFEDKYVIEEYYTMIQNIDGNLDKDMYKIGYVGKLVSVEESKKYSTPWLTFENGNGVSGINFRKSTEQEISEYTKSIFYFGKVKFVVKRGATHAVTSYGEIGYHEINNAINWIQHPPSLIGNMFSIHTDDSCKYIHNFKDTCCKLSIGFGCQRGNLSELVAIRDAFNNLE